MYSMLLPIMLLGLWPASDLFASLPDPAAAIAIAPPARSLSIPGSLSASGVAIIDAKSGQLVYSRQVATPRPMASITKLMTALLIVENHDMNEVVRIPDNIASVPGNKAYLNPGEQFTVGELLSALLIASANDAAVALAHFHSGNVTDFVAEMNARAATLGLKDTSYANPHGLDDSQQYSSPQNIAWLTSFVLREPEIRRRMGKRWERIHSLQGTEISLNHTHALLHQLSPVIAGKTGTTDAAGECLVSLVEYEDREYVVVLMNSSGRYQDMQSIFQHLNQPLAKL